MLKRQGGKVGGSISARGKSVAGPEIHFEWKPIALRIDEFEKLLDILHSNRRKYMSNKLDSLPFLQVRYLPVGLRGIARITSICKVMNSSKLCNVDRFHVAWTTFL